MLRKEGAMVRQSDRSKLDRQLDNAKRFALLFNIDRYFSFIQKVDTIRAVPFYIAARNLQFSCRFMYQGKKLGDVQTYYCANEDHIAQYAACGNKIVTCQGCDHFIK